MRNKLQVAAVLFLLLGVSIQSGIAQIVYTNVNPDIVATGSYNLDLNNDGAVDFVINHKTGKSVKSNICSGTKINQVIDITPSANRYVFNYQMAYVSKMPGGANINSSGLWNSNSHQFLVNLNWACLPAGYGSYLWASSTTPGQWSCIEGYYSGSCDVSYDGFIGLSFVSGGHSYYGWCRLNISSDGTSFTIKDYAYSSTADQPIFAGQDVNDYLVISTIPIAFCAGEHFTIPFIVTGTFSTSNVITAQLSDQYGNFANPMTIGSITSRVSGNINATIPASAVTGNGYKIRVVSTNPVRISYPNPDNISITNNGPPSGTIYADNTNICAGYGVALTAPSQSCWSHQWKLNGNDIAGATSPDYRPTIAGNYSCVISSTLGTMTSNVIAVTKELPSPNIFIEATTCDGYVHLRPEGWFYAYQWKLNGNDAPNGNNNEYSASTLGNYSCVLTSTCGIQTSNTVSVNAIPPSMADAVITPVGPAAVCNPPATLQANTGVGLTYQWYNSAQLITGAASSSLNVTTSGDYHVVETNNYGCIRVSWYTPVWIGTPPPPQVSPSSGYICHNNPIWLYGGDSSDSGNFFFYQWKKDGVNIPGETQHYYLAQTPGTYSITASAYGGCGNTSSGAVLVKGCPNTGAKSEKDTEVPAVISAISSLTISPNPVSASANISFTLNQTENVSLRMYDMNGRLIATLADRQFIEGIQQVKWNTGNVKAGIYILKLETAQSVQSKKIIVLK